MRLLLDTHIFVWSLSQPEKLASKVRRAIAASDDNLWLSPISIWEMLLLAEKGRISLPSESPAKWLRELLATLPLREAPLNHEVAITSRTLELPHRDPADRFIAATALVYDLTLITNDERLIAAEACPILANV